MSKRKPAIHDGPAPVRKRVAHQSLRRAKSAATLASFFFGIAQWLAAMSILFVLLVAASYWSVGYFIRGEEIPAPDVTARTVSEALLLLEEHRLTLQLDHAESSESIPEGSILGQRPRVGTKVKRRSPISVVVSSGPRMIEVPNRLVGLGRIQAGIELRKLGLAVGNVAALPTQARGHDVVLALDPPSPTRLSPGTKVNLLVSLEAVGEKLLMPDLYGLHPAEVTEELAHYDLILGDTILQSNEIVRPGTIFRQEPAAGEQISRGDTVRIFADPGN